MTLRRLNLYNLSLPSNTTVNATLAFSSVSGWYWLPAATTGGGMGYTSGGSASANTIDKFPFSSDSNATNVGNLSQSRVAATGQSSTTNGYTSGGNAPPFVNTIDKFPFAIDANATDVGDLTQGRYNSAGQSSNTHGYTSGGRVGPSSPAPSANRNTIDKFSFATNSNATFVGVLTAIKSGITGQSSDVSGYSSGGNAPLALASKINVIDKFPFSSDGNATDVGDLTVSRGYSAGQSSSSSGYTSGGQSPTVNVNTIDKFPFAANANATDVGDLTQGRYGTAGQSSSTSGYTSGGYASPRVNTIDKFPFASDTSASDVGDLTVIRYLMAGQQSS